MAVYYSLIYFHFIPIFRKSPLTKSTPRKSNFFSYFKYYYHDILAIIHAKNTLLAKNEKMSYYKLYIFYFLRRCI